MLDLSLEGVLDNRSEIPIDSDCTSSNLDRNRLSRSRGSVYD